MEKIKVGILGATSYTGVELLKLLALHPHADIEVISSQSYAGKQLSEIFPEMTGVYDATLLSPDEASAGATGLDCLFSCLPHAVSASLCVGAIEAGVRIIDLSADFRLRDTSVYQKWYGIEHPCPHYLEKAVYGLVEHHRTSIKPAQIIANPGCYVTSVLMPLLPLMKQDGIDVSTIIADSKSGVSGAGRSLKLTSHFVEANENMSAYAVGRAHRHVPEIEQELSSAAGREVTITFAPHLIPLNRGILSTIYLSVNASAKQCEEIVAGAYSSEPFVRMRAPSLLPKVSAVAHTNRCDIAFTEGNGVVIAVSALDNLRKGASGQAVQNMNVMFGFDETTGLL